MRSITQQGGAVFYAPDGEAGGGLFLTRALPSYHPTRRTLDEKPEAEKNPVQKNPESGAGIWG